MSRIFLKNYNFFWKGLMQQLTQKDTHALRLYYRSSKPEKQQDELDCQSSTYKDTSLQYKTGKKYAATKLQEIFNVRLFTALDIATRFKKLQVTTGKTMCDNHQLLTQEGVTDDIILEYPDVLAQKYMEEKIALLKSLPFHISDTMPLLNIELNKFKQFIMKQALECKSIPGGRIGYLSRLLELPIIETCHVLVKRTFLHKIDLIKVETNCKLLTDFGIGLDEIRRDYWVLQYNSEVIEHRLGLAKQLKVEKIKTWMVRAQSEIFNTYIQRRSDNKLILGENSLVEYLSERLECTAETSKIILAKHPALSSKSMKKLKEIIDFLYADGFTPLHIVRSPKILLHSVETTRKRLKELESQGMKVDSLHILTKSQKQYMHYYENLVKSNKSKIKDTI